MMILFTFGLTPSTSLIDWKPQIWSTIWQPANGVRTERQTSKNNNYFDNYENTKRIFDESCYTYVLKA
jgi:hypothetical protein